MDFNHIEYLQALKAALSKAEGFLLADNPLNDNPDSLSLVIGCRAAMAAVSELAKGIGLTALTDENTEGVYQLAIGELLAVREYARLVNHDEAGGVPKARELILHINSVDLEVSDVFYMAESDEH